ncbi:branched-chain amino acid aminotransferase [Saccharothrix ecbatanensis]|uniref:Branched-chain-amino-acid aminotransferase n=1 Tax=Saccharothrix ecbatanensis TaxID=1105145 RepID=A0A7W9HIM7_9PSEU|nr:branched-chain amino acid transaminase [Saccharothrix ecbatanensis]MBB5802999.1 branched-chain amino acid aminotransferase [Saccharothrix ecbatanensis]
MEQQQVIWYDGELVPWSSAQTHITSYGLMLGIGFFEAFRCFETKDGPALFRVDDHLRRLHESGHTYLRTFPYSSEQLKAACKEVVRANGLSECYLRVLVFLGEGANPATTPFRTAVIATTAGPYVNEPDANGFHAKISNVQRPAPSALPFTAKATGQYLNASLALIDALAGGYDSAILLNQSGHVVDGYIHNIFAVRRGVLRTPPVSSGALAGITRDTVLRVAEELDIPVEVEDILPAELYNADEVFLTGTQAGIMPIASVDRRKVGDGKPGAVARALSAAVDDVVHGRTQAHADWLEPV